MIILIARVFCAKREKRVQWFRGSSFFSYAPVVFLLLVKALPRYDEDDAATLVVVARNVTSAVVYVLADENHALVLQLLRLVGLNYRSKYGRGALPSTHGVPHESAAKKGHYLTQWAENPTHFSLIIFPTISIFDHTIFLKAAKSK